MLQRLENASPGFERKPDILISLPLVRREDDGEEEREKLEASQLDEKTILANKPPNPYLVRVETILNEHADSFLEAPVNMINLAWAGKEGERKEACEKARLTAGRETSRRREDKRNDRITNPVKKENPARLGRKWYVVGKNG
ncbi:hypothetical protein ACFX1T_019451 [Malus domestica]